jgi:proton-coupled amino acid transporter
VLTTSLPEGVLATSVQLAYSIAVIFTFPLQNFPALEVVCQTAGLKAGMEEKDPSLLRRNILASIIVCLLAVVAILTIDSLGNVVSLLGSLLGVPIAFIVPAMMHNKLVKDSTKATRWMNNTVVVFGFIAMFAASSTTLTAWDKGSEGGGR